MHVSKILAQESFFQLGQAQRNDTIIRCDNNSTVKLSKNLIIHERYKHINAIFYFLRDLTRDRVIELSHYIIEEQLAGCNDHITLEIKIKTWSV